MERVMSILLNDFAERSNTEVSVLLIGRYRRVEFELNDKIQILKPSFEFDNAKRNTSTLKTLSFIRKTIKSIKPDVILSFGEMWNNLVLLSLSGLNYPVYISDRSQPNKNLGRLHNFLRNKLYPSAEGFIAQTTHAAKIAKKNKWNTKIIVIGNPIINLELSNVQKENVILTVGRLIPTKNVDRLIELFSTINNEDWQLQVIGGNAKQLDLLSEYKVQVKTLKKTKQIYLLGQQKNVEQYLAKSKIFAFMSTSEGFPNALGEAMAAGCACIAYDCLAGPSDMIEDGESGFLIPVGDEALFEEKLKVLMQDQELREKFGKKAKEKMKVFQADIIADNFFKTITNETIRIRE
jgi:GalNAc-alpha-(1->4)-GalNAc-alpha-(1->3)-diNAcBac-PP-undecaprenol alpha-1,4-N-acetyl-D-galactosaminyltransferase